MSFEIKFEAGGPDHVKGGVPGANNTYVFNVASGRWLLGRSDEADIVFSTDRSCSRKAAYLVLSEEGLSISPTEGSSPLIVDGRRVSATTKLARNNLVSFGQQTFRVTEISDAPGRVAQHTSGGESTVIMTRNSGSMGATPSGPDRIDVGEKSVFIGRASDAKTVSLNHPTVSRVHAELRRRGDTTFIRDRGSANGTYVNGSRLSGATALADGDQVSIGPFSFQYSGFALNAVKFDENAPMIEAVGLTMDVKHSVTKKPLRILDDVNLKIMKGELVCFVGASGSGKSTLIDLLSGRNKTPSAGVVRMKGAKLVENFEALKNRMAYVPQNNALHETLSLRQALGFAAKLRLQPDLTASGRAQVIESAAKAVDLQERLDQKIKDLSGGQKKRASLASEMLASPEVLILDEVTSGLDESTDREIMALMRKRADAGMTILCVTHTLANIHAFCDKLVVMGNGGIPTFIGHPREALEFFGVEALGDIFDSLAEAGPERWRARARQQLPAFQNTGGREESSGRMVQPVPANRSKRSDILRQLGILTHRSALLTMADTKFLLMAFIQSIMIGAMLGYAYSEFGDAGEEISSRIALLMALGTSALWLGTNTAASNIVGEATIFQRERDVNVSTLSFVLSKFLVSGVFSVVQVTLVFFLAAALAEDMPGNEAVQMIFMILGGLIGVGIGLSISAFSNTQEQANTIVPLALIPQLILAGVLVPALPEPGVWFSKVSISAFWMTEGMTDVYIQFADKVPTQLNLQTGRPEELEAEPLLLALIVLVGHLIFCVAGAVFLAIRRFNPR